MLSSKFMRRPASTGVVSGQAVSPQQSPFREKRAGQPAIVLALAASITLAGCSADLLRFDSPAFNLNGDTTTAAEADVAPTGSTLYEQRTAAADSAGNYAPAPVARVDRGVGRYRSEPETPSRTSRMDRSYADRSPITTGALSGDRPASGTITVEPGDTLYHLSRRHGISVAALRDANGLASDIIQPGQRLVLPGSTAPRPRTYDRYASLRPERAPDRRAPASREPAYAGDVYTIRPGDSLYAISRRTGVSVSELKRLNDIADARRIRPGARLILRGSSRAGAHRTETRVASRTSPAPRPRITPKSIRTVPITQPNAYAPRASSGPSGSASQPRILNSRPKTPIATKPTRTAAATVDQPERKFRWPARGRIIASFNHTDRGKKNDGINIALPVGTAVHAAEDGVVAYAGDELKGYGNLVLVRHDNGWVSAYAHASEILVKRGDRIERGHVIARAGRSGEVTQPQLHFELRKGATPVDPLPHLAKL